MATATRHRPQLTSPRGTLLTRTLAGGAAAGLLAALLTPGTALAVDRSGRPAEPTTQRLGTAPAAPVGSVRTSAPADSAPLDLSVTLNPRDPAGLESFIGAVSDPKSPQYRRYLKPGQFAQRFGADPATVAQVTGALAAAGLHPGAVDRSGLTIPVTATVAEARHALATDFAGYRLPDGSTAFANTEAPRLPGSIAPRIAGLTGLSTLARPHPQNLAHGPAESVPATGGTGTTGGTGPRPRFTSGQPTTCQEIASLESSKNRADYRDYYSPQALANVYGLPFNGGAGTTVAFFELEDFSDAAVAAYQRCFGTNASISRIKVNGGPTTQPTATNTAGQETALDLETVIGLVPNADLLVYQGPDRSPVSDSDVLAVYRQIVNDDRAQVVSTSWGQCEQLIALTTLQAENVIFQQAAAQGQTVLAVAGDSGSTDCYRGTPNPQSSVLATDDPGSQPYVTAVGGTSMTGGNGTPLQQTVWNSHGGAGGGGVSSVWSLDSAAGFQAGVTGPGYTNACNAPAGRTCRQVPDVSASADPGHGYLVSVFADSTATNWMVLGGTSAAAPLWAALVADADSGASCAASGPLGYLNPLLYRMPGALTDVTQGGNALPGSGYTGPDYSAGPGYDLASGLGTPSSSPGATTDALCGLAPLSPASTYQPAAPVRLLDTRDHNTPVAAYGTQTLKITGGAVPTTGVTSVVLNITVTDTVGDGHLTVYPSGSPQPITSNINWTAGTTVPNLVTVPVGADGSIRLYNSSWGTTDLVVDLQGYYVGDAGGAGYRPSGPSRVLDTRFGIGAPQAPLGGWSSQTLNLANLAGAPVGTRAVVLNVTVTNPATPGHLTVYPSGSALPTTSNLNWSTNETISNQVIAPVGADGSIRLYNSSDGSTDVIVDLFGYLVGDASSALFHSPDPHRLLDTRAVVGGPSTPFGPDEVRTLKLDGGGPLAHAKAVVLNVTVTETADAGHLTVYASGSAQPNTSNLNWTAGQTISNMVTAAVGSDGTVSIHNGSWSTTDVVVDLLGYYS